MQEFIFCKNGCIKLHDLLSLNIKIIKAGIVHMIIYNAMDHQVSDCIVNMHQDQI